MEEGKLTALLCGLNAGEEDEKKDKNNKELIKDLTGLGTQFCNFSQNF